MRTFSRSVALMMIALMLLPLSNVASEPDESGNFSDTQSNGHFTTGFLEGEVNIGEDVSFSIRIDYPSTNGSGEMVEMAWQGAPFPVIVFFVDDGEELDNYDWITQSLASSGYIVITPEDRWESSESEELLSEIKGLYSAIRNVNIAGFEDDNQPDNFIGGFDVDHWGVGGHGTGGALAAITQASWDSTLNNDTYIPPRALFGLGLDKSGMPSVLDLTPHIPTPSFALFLTGTVDEIAPAHQNVQVVLEDWPGGWHFMEVRGANHLQYQDETGFFEPLTDGTATMSESEQKNHALEHISPYLDLVLKGDHNDWIAASNRESNISIPSDQNSYLDEDLSNSKLLTLVDAQGPSVEIELGNMSNFSVLTTHRNGAFISSNNSEFTFVCSVIGFEDVLASGSIDDITARSSCSMDLDQLSPGTYDVMLKASVDGMPTSVLVSVTRGNTGMTLIEPTPNIVLDQHGTAVISASEFASDPDGQIIHFHNASWMSTEGANFDLSWNGSDMTISHSKTPEWSGSTLLAIVVKETNTENPVMLDLVTQVTVMPVNDQVEIINQIPSQEMYEDGEQLILDISPWFLDPEGEPLQVTAASSDERLSLSVEQTNITMTSAVDWNGAAIVSINVSDGFNPPVAQSIPVQIIPTDDEPKYNASAWNVTFEEDEVATIALSTLVWDPDGDQMSYIFTADESIGEFAFLIEEGTLTIQPPPNWNGMLELGWLNASDSNNTISNRFAVEVIPVNDQPQVQWQQSKWNEDILMIEYSYLDVDDEVNHVVRYRIDDGMMWYDAASSCQDSQTEIQQCSFNYNASQLSVGGHTIDLVIVDENIELEPQRQVFTVASDEKTGPDDFSSLVSKPATWVVIIGCMLVLFAIRLSFGGEKQGSELAGAVQKETKYDDSNNLEEVIELDDEKPQASGLLAKAQNLQEKS